MYVKYRFHLIVLKEIQAFLVVWIRLSQNSNLRGTLPPSPPPPPPPPPPLSPSPSPNVLWLTIIIH